MGLGKHRCPKLASLDLDVPFVGCPVVWPEPSGPPRHECCPSCAQHRDAVPAAAKDDRRTLAQFCGGGIVRVASTPRGICGLGFRTKRCVERVLLAAHDLGLCPLRGNRKFKVQSPKPGIQRQTAPHKIESKVTSSVRPAPAPSLSTLLVLGRRVFVRLRAVVQADVSYTAVCTVVAGLLAAEKIYDLRFTIYDFPALTGEDPLSSSGGGQLGGDLHGARARRRGHSR